MEEVDLVTRLTKRVGTEFLGKKLTRNRVKELKMSPMYREYRDRQNAMARARRKDRKNDGR
jgi:hypothetical protein